MNLLRCLTAILSIAAAADAASSCGGRGNQDTLLVSAGWLNQHLHDSNLVILAVGRRNEYDQEHIPGAWFLEYMDTHTMAAPGSSELTLELPPMPQLVDVFEKLGVSNGSHIVLYETSDWAAPTARVFLTLDAMGLGAQTSILDGGFPAWRRRNYRHRLRRRRRGGDTSSPVRKTT